MSWTSIVSSLNRSWTKTLSPAKKWLLHICCCGYAGVFPQTKRFGRRFGGCLVFQWWLNLPVLHMNPLSAVSCQQEAVVLPCAGLGVSTFFLKTKKRSSSVGSTSTTFAFAFALVAGAPVFPREAASLY
jgi:hypothetical protein